jgi:outer membrane protein OmpA-like peptidoglycan-associated protein
MTKLGDSGLWYVPTADTLGRGKWMASAQRNSRNTAQGHMNIADFSGTFAAGLAPRVDVFGSWDVVTRVDRDVRPLFVPTDPQRGGVDPLAPFAREAWSGNRLGDLTLGAKFRFLSHEAGGPLDLAARGLVKLPTGDKEEGGGSGATDGGIDLILSRWVSSDVVVSGTAGYLMRGSPDEPAAVDIPSLFVWGAGLGWAPRRSWLFSGEIYGELPADDEVPVSPALVAADSSVSPLVSDLDTRTRATVGLTWFARNGFFLGGALNFEYPQRERDSNRDHGIDYADVQVRLGYRPVNRIAAAAPPPPPPPPVVQPPANRPPTVKASCEPCTVPVGGRADVIAVGDDPDKDPLQYRWQAAAGTLERPTDPRTPWVAPNQPGAVPITVTVDDGRGGKASDTVTIQVTQPAQKVYTFEDVHFDFDRYSLRPEALRILDDAVKALKESPGLRLTVEGHTCSIGTTEYNLALGERRANAARDYLVSQGVTADRLRTISFGEERPKHDNSREETRRLNRRASLVVRVE